MLGVIKAMGALDQSPEVLGHLIGAALVGTFAGIFFSYAVVSPIATKIKIVREKKMRLYIIVKQTLLAFMNGAMPQIALEHGRKTISAYERPTIDEVEQRDDGGRRAGGCRARTQGGGVSAMTGASAERPLTARQLAELFAARGNGVERLPLLRVVMETAASACTEEVRTLIGMPLRLGLRRHRIPARGATCCERKRRPRRRPCSMRSAGTRKLLVRADRAAVFAIVETMLGGDGSQPPHAAERALSAHRDRARRVLLRARSRAALATAFAEVADTTFSIDAPMDRDGPRGPSLREHAGRRSPDIASMAGAAARCSSPSRMRRSSPCASRSPQAPAKAEARRRSRLDPADPQARSRAPT